MRSDATAAASAARLPSPDLDWPIAWAGVALIAEREGCRLVAYRCPAGVWTCGWGETSGVTPRTRWTQEYADARLRDALAERAAAVLAMCRREPTDHQLAALVSLSYNIGAEALRRSSVLAAHNRGDEQAAAEVAQRQARAVERQLEDRARRATDDAHRRVAAAAAAAADARAELERLRVALGPGGSASGGASAPATPASGPDGAATSAVAAACAGRLVAVAGDADACSARLGGLQQWVRAVIGPEQPDGLVARP